MDAGARIDVIALVNQHSFPLLAGGLLGGAALVVRRGGERGWRLLALVATGLVVTQLVLRTGGSPFASIEAAEAELAGGQPTLVEFYSDY